MKRIGTLFFSAIIVANGWFAYKSQSMFYTDEMAYQKVLEAIPEHVEYWNINIETLEPEVRFDGLTLLERLDRWPDLFDEYRHGFPVRTFLWQYREHGQIKTLHLSLMPIGIVFGRMNHPAALFEEYPIYKNADETPVYSVK